MTLTPSRIEFVRNRIRDCRKAIAQLQMELAVLLEWERGPRGVPDDRLITPELENLYRDLEEYEERHLE